VRLYILASGLCLLWDFIVAGWKALRGWKAHWQTRTRTPDIVYSRALTETARSKDSTSILVCVLVRCYPYALLSIYLPYFGTWKEAGTDTNHRKCSVDCRVIAVVPRQRRVGLEWRSVVHPTVRVWSYGDGHILCLKQAIILA
jgi:hypothetical protein